MQPTSDRLPILLSSTAIARLLGTYPHTKWWFVEGSWSHLTAHFVWDDSREHCHTHPVAQVRLTS